jgi:hypothetical protein
MDSTDREASKVGAEEHKHRLLREALGLSYQDFRLSRRGSEECSRTELVRLVCAFARADRSGENLFPDGSRCADFHRSDLLLSQLASEVLGTLAARAQSGNEWAQRLFFDCVADSVTNFESLAFQNLEIFRQRARKRAEIPAMASRIKGHQVKTRRLLEALEQGDDCPRAGVMAFTPVPWLVDHLFMAMTGIRRTGSMYYDLIEDDFVRQFVNLKPLSLASVDSWIGLSWAWLLRSTNYTRDEKLQPRAAEQDHLANSQLFDTQPLNEKPGELWKRFRAAWRDLAHGQGKHAPKNGDSSAEG